jgi:glycosyltransferase involved in cell wall biosynthesis
VTPHASRRERWLILAEESFVPATSGGRVETLNFVRAVEHSEIDLDLVVPIKASQDRLAYRELLDATAVTFVERRTGLGVLLGVDPYVFASRPVPPGLVHSFLRQPLSARPTAVISYSFRMAHIGIALAASLDVPHLVRCYNLESAYFGHLARSATGLRGTAYRAEWWRVRRAEAAIHRSAHVSCFADISIEDHRARRALTAVPTLHLPPFLPAARSSGRHPIACSVLFVGSLDSAVNQEAVDWLLSDCWRRIRARHSAATLRIVGRNPPESLRRAAAASPGVELLADVRAVEPHLAAAKVFANPVRRGSGVNIKVVEAMAAGVPVVATTAGSRGLLWEPGRHLLVADHPIDFADRVVELLADPTRRHIIGEAGRRFITDALDPATLLERMRHVLRSKGSPSR